MSTFQLVSCVRVSVICCKVCAQAHFTPSGYGNVFSGIKLVAMCVATQSIDHNARILAVAVRAKERYRFMTSIQLEKTDAT